MFFCDIELIFLVMNQVLNIDFSVVQLLVQLNTPSDKIKLLV